MTWITQKAILALNAVTGRQTGSALIKNSIFLKETRVQSVQIVRQIGDVPSVIGIVLKETLVKNVVPKNDPSQ